MKITFLDESSANLNGDMDFSKLHELGELTTYSGLNTEKEIISCSKDTSYVIVNKIPMTKRVIDALPELKHIAVLATGYNNIDLTACENSGVTVSNVRGYARDSVPQHVFALMLNLATKTNEYHNEILKGEWQTSDSFTLLKYPTFELAGKTIGIVGFGSIGREVAKIADAFGMNVIINRESRKSEGKYAHYSLDDLLKVSDVVSLNCPLTAENKYMINADTLKQMKRSAILINTARGPLVNQSDLAVALNEDWIAGAGIDVLDEEPPKDNPLIGKVKNLILTPHSAWSTREARQRLIDDVALTIESLEKGLKRNLL